MKTLFAIFMWLLFASQVYAQPSAPWPSSMFAIVANFQCPKQTGTADHASYANEAAGMVAAGINVAVADGCRPMMTGFGVDDGTLEDVLAANTPTTPLYFVAGNLQIDYAGNTSNTSVASYQALAANIGATNLLAGYFINDEPMCDGAGGASGTNLSELIPGEVANVASYDPNRLVWVNDWSWAANTALLGPQADNPPNTPDGVTCYTSYTTQFRTAHVRSFDHYPWIDANGLLTRSPHISYVAGTDCANSGPCTHVTDSLFMDFLSEDAMRSLLAPGQLFGKIVETGTDGNLPKTACNPTTNMCPDGSEMGATPSQVIAEAWGALISGANWLGEWTFSAANGRACGYGGSNNVAGETQCQALGANLKALNASIQSFAPVLNGVTLASLNLDSIGASGVTGGGQETLVSSLSSADLAMSSSLLSLPGHALLKEVTGGLSPVYYLLAQSERSSESWGQGTGWNNTAGATYTFGVQGGLPTFHTATPVLDTCGGLGSPIKLSGNTFSDIFGAACTYQARIYRLQ